MKHIIATASLALAFSANSIFASNLTAGPILAQRSDGGESAAFIFVECKGKLMLAFSGDKKLNRLKPTDDGGYLAKYNKGKYQLTFYPNGTMKKRNGDISKWRKASNADIIKFIKADGKSASEAKQIASERMVQAQAKC